MWNKEIVYITLDLDQHKFLCDFKKDILSIIDLYEKNKTKNNDLKNKIEDIFNKHTATYDGVTTQFSWNKLKSDLTSIKCKFILWSEILNSYVYYLTRWEEKW